MSSVPFPFQFYDLPLALHPPNHTSSPSLRNIKYSLIEPIREMWATRNTFQNMNRAELLIDILDLGSMRATIKIVKLVFDYL